MKLGPQLLLLLNKTYEPSTLIETAFQRYDLAFKINEEGKPYLLFIGKKNERGKIRGQRFARQLLTDNSGRMIKDH